jgi:hypothetical protein
LTAGDPAPGSEFDGNQVSPQVALGVANRTPYVAPVAGGVRGGPLTLWRLDRAGTGWTQLGGVVNHDPAQLAHEPQLTAGGSTEWITWSELDAQGISQVRLGRVVGDSVREVVGGPHPINDPDGGSSGQARPIVYGGRTYVSYRDTTGIRAVRTRPGLRSFERVDAGLEGLHGFAATPLVSGGRLFLVTEIPGGAEVRRLNRRGTRWETIPVDGRLGTYITFFSRVAWARHVAYRAFKRDSYDGPGSNALLVVEAFLNDAWQPIPGPGVPGFDVQGLRLVGSDGVLWILWDEGQSSMSPQRLVHVARLAGSP